MEREEYFLKYNHDNIFVNLLQAEDHLRNLSETDNSDGHNACIVKHLMITEVESNEAYSHAENPDIYYKIRSGCNELRSKLSSIKVHEAIQEVRTIRKTAEHLDPSYNIEDCRACDKMKSAISKHLNSSTSLEKDKHLKNKPRGVIMKTDLRTLGIINGGQAAGYLLKYGTDWVTTKYPAATPTTWNDKGLWTALGVGIGGQLLAARFMKDGNLKLATMIGLSHLAVSKVGDVVKDMATTPAARLRGRIPARAPAANARIIPRAPVAAPPVAPQMGSYGSPMQQGLVTVD